MRRRTARRCSRALLLADDEDDWDEGEAAISMVSVEDTGKEGRGQRRRASDGGVRCWLRVRMVVVWRRGRGGGEAGGRCLGSRGEDGCCERGGRLRSDGQAPPKKKDARGRKVKRHVA